MLPFPFVLRTAPRALTGAVSIVVVAWIAFVFPVVATGLVWESDHHALEAKSGLRNTL